MLGYFGSLGWCEPWSKLLVYSLVALWKDVVFQGLFEATTTASLSGYGTMVLKLGLVVLQSLLLEVWKPRVSGGFVPRASKSL